MKHIGLLLLAASLATGAVAQDLDNTIITDQFDTGERGNNDGGLNWVDGNYGASNPDGSEFTDYSGTDATATPTTSIRYINTWASRAYYGNSEVESPVLDVTSGPADPDNSGLFLPAVTANNRPGATNGSMAVIIGDDTGHNGLFFGDAEDANYYVEVDMYCHDRSAEAGNGWYEVAGLAARAGRDTNGTTEPLHEPVDYTYNVDRAGSYCLYYNYFTKEVRAVKWIHGNSSSAIVNDDVSSPTTFIQYGNTIENVTAGWHTFRIDCLGDDITFTFDGTEVANITDSSETKYPFGRPGLYYREQSTNPEYQAYFDNLKAGPTAQAKVSDWTLY